jgi:hypothetical protein
MRGGSYVGSRDGLAVLFLFVGSKRIGAGSVASHHLNGTRETETNPGGAYEHSK